MIVLAIDPSIRSAGAALFHAPPGDHVREESRLIAVARVTLSRSERSDEIAENENAMARKIYAWAGTVLGWQAFRVDQVVSERPQIYQRTRGRSKADPNDQLAMVGVTAGLIALLTPPPRVKTYLPAEWKGQLDKPKILRRVRAVLRPDELALLDAAGAATDPGEAVGVGLKWLGRLEPHRVYPGATPG